MTASMTDPTVVSIVIPAFNQLQYCEQCVKSIILNTRYPYRLILVDNGSTDGVGEYFDSVQGATVIHAGENKGFAGGVNLGMREAEGHVLLLNSDTLVPAGWLDAMVHALESDDRIGLVGPMSNCVSGPQEIADLHFTALSDIDAYFHERQRTHAGRRVDVARLVGFCLLIRDATVAQVGHFDEAFGIGNFEDDDYCLRAMRAGWRLCIAEDCFVFHYGSRTFVDMGITGEKWDAQIAKNEQLFMAKNAAKPEERNDAVQQARQRNREAQQALQGDRLDDALRALEEGIQLAPAFALNYNDLGVVLWQLGEQDRAFDCFKAAVERDRGMAAACENLRDAAEALGRRAEVERLLS